jgi:hypothetical protein
MCGLRPQQAFRLRAGRDLLDNVRRVPAQAGEHHRAEGVLERETAEEEAGRRVDPAAVLPRPAVVADYRQVDPVEGLPEAGAPDDVGDVEHPSVIQHRSRVGRHRGHPSVDHLDADFGEVLRLDPEPWSAVVAHRLHLLAPHRGASSLTARRCQAEAACIAGRIRENAPDSVQIGDDCGGSAGAARRRQ